MRLVEALLAELLELSEKGTSFASTEFPVDTGLGDGDSVEWVASTFADELMHNIYHVSDENGDDYISSSHGDGGVVVFYDGPWATLQEAEAAFGDVVEGWLRN